MPIKITMNPNFPGSEQLARMTVEKYLSQLICPVHGKSPDIVEVEQISGAKGATYRIHCCCETLRAMLPASVKQQQDSQD
jgi:hypothetical protein